MTPTKQILVIDDEESIREVVRACLEDIGGWQACLADSGQTGLAAASGHSFDAILLDISMPDLDGFEIFRRLQQQPDAHAIPVVLLTAKVLSEDRDRFQRMGVAGVITKPFNPITLCQEVSALLGWEEIGCPELN